MTTLETLKDLLDPKAIEEMAFFFKKKAQIKLHNMERMKKFYHDEKSFDVLMEKIISKHNDRWSDACQSNGIEPHPWQILYAVFDIAEEEGKEIEPLDSFTKNFPSMLWEHMGWTFAVTHGQGSVASIYRGEDLIYRD